MNLQLAESHIGTLLYIYIYIYIYEYTNIYICIYIYTVLFFLSLFMGGMIWLFIVGLFCLPFIICMLTLLLMSAFLCRMRLCDTLVVIFLNKHHHHMYCISDVSCLRLSCCINALFFCVHYLYLIGRVYVFYVGYVDKNSLYETLFLCNTLSEYHHQADSFHHRVEKECFR
jgi:hypothetical protein